MRTADLVAAAALEWGIAPHPFAFAERVAAVCRPAPTREVVRLRAARRHFAGRGYSQAPRIAHAACESGRSWEAFEAAWRLVAPRPMVVGSPYNPGPHTVAALCRTGGARFLPEFGRLPNSGVAVDLAGPRCGRDRADAVIALAEKLGRLLGSVHGNLRTADLRRLGCLSRGALRALAGAGLLGWDGDVVRSGRIEWAAVAEWVRDIAAVRSMAMRCRVRAAAWLRPSQWHGDQTLCETRMFAGSASDIGAVLRRSEAWLADGDGAGPPWLADIAKSVVGRVAAGVAAERAEAATHHSAWWADEAAAAHVTAGALAGRAVEVAAVALDRLRLAICFEWMPPDEIREQLGYLSAWGGLGDETCEALAELRLRHAPPGRHGLDVDDDRRARFSRLDATPDVDVVVPPVRRTAQLRSALAAPDTDPVVEVPLRRTRQLAGAMEWHSDADDYSIGWHE